MDPTIFLDIDGVLLGHPAAGDPNYCLANHAITFLRQVTESYEVAWATTHCRRGDAGHAIEYLRDHAQPDQREELTRLALRVQPTRFETLKTDIFRASPAQRWLWIEDSPMATELEVLRGHDWESRLVLTNTQKRPDDLLRVLKLIKGHPVFEMRH